MQASKQAACYVSFIILRNGDARTARSNSRAAAQRGVGQRELRSKEISKIYLLQNVTKQGLRDMYNIKLEIVEVSKKRKLSLKRR